VIQFFRVLMESGCFNVRWMTVAMGGARRVDL
jgi:hypothetical protein